jgi:predicted permease
VLGVLAAVVIFHVPTYPDKSLTILGNATEATTLFVTGLIASAQRFNLDWGVDWAILGKNLFQLALCVAVTLLLGMPLEQTRYVALLRAIPCASSAFSSAKVSAQLRNGQARAPWQALCLGSLHWMVLLSHLH